MPLRDVVEKMFPGENVSPDFSSYQAMVAKWRGSKPAPSEAEIESKRTEYSAEYQKTLRDAARRKRYNELGVTVEALVIAKIEKDEEGRPQELQRLMTLRQQVKSEIP